MSTNGHHFDYALASDEVQRALVNGALAEHGFSAHMISKAKWQRWPDSLVEAVRRGTWDKDYDDD
jgi:hypothetical protein